MRYFQLIFAILVFGFLTSCGGSTDPLPEEGEIIEDPVSATLVFPENNTECQEGIIIDELRSRVTFQWLASEHTDSYEVHLKNLNDDTESLHDSNTNEASIILERGTPYNWYVLSKSDNSNNVAESETWQFYNAGLGQVSHAPFPAGLLNPTNGETIEITNGTTTLNWEASDIDNDIVQFEVLFGTTNPPTEIAGTTSSSELSVNLDSGTTYFWFVRTIDSNNNLSESDIFSFRAN